MKPTALVAAILVLALAACSPRTSDYRVRVHDKGLRPMTGPERSCLQYLSHKLEASSEAIGNHIADVYGIRADPNQIGQGVLSSLSGHGLVMRVNITGGWTITRAGRDALRRRVAEEQEVGA